MLCLADDALSTPVASFITRDYGESPKLNIVMEYVDHGTYPLSSLSPPPHTPLSPPIPLPSPESPPSTLVAGFGCGTVIPFFPRHPSYSPARLPLLMSHVPSCGNRGVPFVDASACRCADRLYPRPPPFSLSHTHPTATTLLHPFWLPLTAQARCKIKWTIFDTPTCPCQRTW